MTLNFIFYEIKILKFQISKMEIMKTLKIYKLKINFKILLEKENYKKILLNNENEKIDEFKNNKVFLQYIQKKLF